MYLLKCREFRLSDGVRTLVRLPGRVVQCDVDHINRCDYFTCSGCGLFECLRIIDPWASEPTYRRG